MLRSLALAVALLNLSAAGCSTSSETQEASPGTAPASVRDAATGEPFLLDEGDAVQVAGHALRFDSVVEDSRCPANTSCVWEGRAKIQLTASSPTGASESAILTVPPSGAMRDGETATWEIGGVVVDLLALSPYPGSEADENEAPSQAQLAVRAK